MRRESVRVVQGKNLMDFVALPDGQTGGRDLKRPRTQNSFPGDGHPRQGDRAYPPKTLERSVAVQAHLLNATGLMDPLQSAASSRHMAHHDSFDSP